MDNDEFERQLLLESKEKALKEQNVKNNPYLRTDPTDGTLYEYDPEKKAWFPKIDDTFLAYYQQCNYQYVEPKEEEQLTKNKSDDKKEEEEVNKLKSNKKKKTETDQNKSTTEQSSSIKQNKNPEWFNVDDEHNTNVYINNLPEDITMEEFIELMQKCGLILKDTETNQYKIKLYKNKDGKLKGDGLCTYIKPESVTLALQILDGYRYKDKELSVEKAKFELKGEYDPSKKPRKRKEEKDRQKKRLKRLFDWQEKLPEERSKREKVVIIKNFFDPTEFDKDPTLIPEYKQDVEEECTAKCGPVKKIEIYDRNPEGVVAVFFKEFEHADKCVELMDGRFFAGRQLSAQNWDGRTKYKIKETEEEEKRRIEEWNKYLEDE